MSNADRVIDAAKRFEADAAARGLDVEIVEHLAAARSRGRNSAR